MVEKITIIAEHNEAFKKIVHFHLKNNVVYDLIHIDEHHDLGSPIVNQNSWNQLIKDKEQIDIISPILDDITFNQLKISDYIISSIYYGAVNSVFWLSNRELEKYMEFTLETEAVSESHMLISIKPEIISGGGNNFLLEVKPDTNIEAFMKNRIILSIDLDYFSCNDVVGEHGNIEITENEYKSFITDNNHKFKLLFGSKVAAYSREGHYFLEYNEFDGPLENKIRNKDDIIIKIDQIIKFLIFNNVIIDYLIICRSNISGYTTTEEAIWMETKLIDAFEMSGLI
ncbi:UPF0489 family protein [Tissierella pigra]|uniref:Uncharacterized protein n=1 Tax=Tissierella pigra TaxID=2607614 RepID=A0A6N7XJ41_9FIRM|nr:UPF0489 family protein [Tissierella pigra]MBU5426111.1 UPF0489 family protein [Tissierella pigra]MSU00772.1 hypothetical protein [Tissierella pigra]